jgi:hypothetical protein
MRRYASVTEIAPRDETSPAFVQLCSYVEAVRGNKMSNFERELILDSLVAAGPVPGAIADHELVTRIAESDRYLANGIESALRHSVDSASFVPDSGWVFFEP